MNNNTQDENLQGRILIVDDEENIREILKAALKPLTKAVFTAESAECAMTFIEEENIDVVICDIKMPGMDGLEFLQKVKQEQPGVKFLMITAHGSMETVIKAMRLGASDFFTKPFENSDIRSIVKKLLLENLKRSEPVSNLAHSPKIEGIIGESDNFVACQKVALKAAVSDSSVLILGESGTGKEVLAKAIHQNSPRKDKAFIAINCGAIPENLMESELFGYEKGAFTGAMESKPGKFTLAHGGTIFLDEIGELPLTMQVKLLRVLQEKKVDPVGALTSIDIDFRLLAATNQNLQQAVFQGDFREDLFYRLNIIPIELPSLRSRGQDILLLAGYFLNKFNQRYDTAYQLAGYQKDLLMDYNWPGNIRELENQLERAVVLGENNTLNLSLPTTSTQSPQRENIGDFKLIKQKHEKDVIISTLDKNRWNKTRTAADLGISRRCLLYKVKEYEIA